MNTHRKDEVFNELLIVIEELRKEIQDLRKEIQTKKKTRRNVEETAIGCLFTRPDLKKVCEIANELGVCRQTLYGFRVFREIATLKGKMKPPKGVQECHVPRGEKTNGYIEAEDYREVEPGS